jgi:cellulose biosynthesis protein BcsQ
LVTRRRPIEAALTATDFIGLDLLPANFSYRNLDLELDDTKNPTRRLERLLRSVADDYDFVFLDCPPSISVVSENVLRASDVLLVPLMPTTLSLQTFDRLIRFVADSGGRQARGAGLLLHGRPPQEAAPQGDRDPPARAARVAETVVPTLSVIEQMAEQRAPLPAFAPNSPAAARYERLWEEVRPT